MAQETFYFSHDYNPISDTKLQALVGEYGAEGYGIFWRVVEKLHAEEEHKLPLKQYLYAGIGKQLYTSTDTVKSVIDACIEDFELFFSDGETFWSQRVLRNIKKREETVASKSKAGKASALARKNLAKLAEKYPDIDISDLTGVEHVLTDVEHVSTKERK
jgi:uncharacterized protein YdaU (DUF1376 family)